MTETTIERIYERLDALLAEFDPDGKGPRYKRSADPFSFEAQPRTELTSFYIAPPDVTQRIGYLGGASNDVATVRVFLAAEARDDADGAARRLAGDLARFKRTLLSAGVLGDDANVWEQGFSMLVQPRPAGAVAIVGRAAFAVDYDTDDAHP